MTAPLLALLTAGTESEGAAAGAHEGPAAILMHHVLDTRLGDFVVGPMNLGPTRHLLFFFIAGFVLLALMRWALASYRGTIPRGIAAFVEILVIYIRDEVAEKNIGHGDGRKFTPLLLSFFFFILIAAFVGLLPFSATATGNLSVTLGLATVSFLAMQYAGISKYGLAHHLAALLPPGLPLWLVPIMIPVEILGVFSKPFALMIRLFANMLAGHMVITALLLLIPLTAVIGTVFGVFMIPVSVGLSLFIDLLEILVAFIQAYIFTLLSAIFIGMYAHPAH